MPSKYFLLSIAINEYQSPFIHNLDGCLEDAAKLQFCLREILGPAPATSIRSLTNAEATRDTIISSFYEHLIDNRDINKDDPIIIYYAGHGSRVPAPQGWGSPACHVETICPSDESMGPDDDLVPGIPDFTINALLRILAREKGNNITFICDSCHSGGIDREIADEHTTLRPRFCGRSVPIPPGIDRAILDHANGSDRVFGFHGDRSSHILLAACAAEERAYEASVKPSGGLFTTALTHELNRLGGRIATTTYSNFISSVKLSNPRQTPQCEGHLVNRYLFSSRTTSAPCVFRLTRERDGFRVDAGEAQGVVVGTEMMVYSYTHASTPTELGVLVVSRVGPVSSTLQIKRGDPFIVPADSWAGVHRWNTGGLTVFPASLLDSTSYKSEYYPLNSTWFKWSSHIALCEEGSKDCFTIERPTWRDCLINTHTRNSIAPRIPRDLSLPSVLAKIAHFNFHLEKGSAAKELDNVLVSDYTGLRIYRMTADDGLKPDTTMDLFENNTARLSMASHGYGIEIFNKSHWDLYAYLFCFDPSDYSITALCLPSLGLNRPPLRRNGSITVGYGPDGGDPFKFCLQSTDNKFVDTVFFKLFVCTKNINMHHISQSSPLVTSPASTPHSNNSTPGVVSRGVLQPLYAPPPEEGFWDVSVAAVTISACPKPAKRGPGVFWNWRA
ncbi:caspase domain-containing protein [Mycena epipterygia]|nr:caspase domain-containing protein [Mycena epipterygia]